MMRLGENLPSYLETIAGEKFKTIGEIALSTTPTLKELVKNFSKDDLKIEIIKIIFNCVKKINIGKPMNVEQIKDCAETIVYAYPNYHIADIEKCFVMALKCEFGQQFDRVDEPTIMYWLKCYDSIRLEKIIEHRKKEHSLTMSQQMANIAPLIKETVEKIAKEKSAKDNDNKPLPKVDKRIKAAMKEFDELYFSQHQKQLSAVRFVKVGDKMMDIAQFIEYKLDND